MKNGYTMVRRLKLTPFEIRVAIEALNIKRLNQKAHGIDNRETSNRVYQNINERVVQTVPQIARSRAYQICSASLLFHGT